MRSCFDLLCSHLEHSRFLTDSHLIAEEGTLKEQGWWEHTDVQKVRDKAERYGCKKGNLPVAVYWYQKYQEDEPGYMPTGYLPLSISILKYAIIVLYSTSIFSV